jgi:hypothetical protein
MGSLHVLLPSKIWQKPDSEVQQEQFSAKAGIIDLGCNPT